MENAELFLVPGTFEEKFVRSAGHGGQNVNKVSTAVQLRFFAGRAGFAPAALARLGKLAGARLTAEGDILIVAGEYRTQQQNRLAARARLLDLIARALRVPVRRKPTRPTRASKARRLDAKKRRSAVKQLRRGKDF
ncbi:MAG: alternative ribosome rescue aminoacyl-tRNA hydrolase ArfB [Elusimicrobiaceae bacterium]|nr:alternative ribosome rescue aminoacyl-tRNA hydrolase ArfB [Elusimicrobiaceae bacterium]